MYQHRRSPQSQASVQCSPESSWDLVLIRGLEFSTQLRGLLVPDADMFGNSWNSSPFLSMTQQHANGFYPPTVDQVSLLFTWVYRRSRRPQVDTIMNIYDPLLGHPPTHHLTLSPSDEVRITTRVFRIIEIITNVWISDLSG
jgi:hypothetical protein